MNKLEKLLRDNAKDVIDDCADFFGCQVNYSEDINPDAINSDAWLENRTSFIWKVGTLAVIDGNKADWAYLYIGHQRKETSDPELIGKLHWQGGENDDIGRCLRRYISTLDGLMDPIFDAD